MEIALDAFDLDRDEVPGRFQAARQRGLPHWLWPDVPFERWRVSLRAIEGAISSVLGGRIGEASLGDDPDSLGIACYTSGMGPLLGWWTERGLISPAPAVAALLALHLAHNRLRIARMTEHASGVVSAFGASGVAATIVKGMHTAHAYFPEPGVRPLSDIDLLVSPSDEAVAGEILSSMGFEPGRTSHWPPQRQWHPNDVGREPRTLCFVHADDPWCVDLQTSLSRRPAAGGRFARLDEARRDFSCARWSHNPHAAVLVQPLQLLQLAVHASCGLESLTLLRMVELILVIRNDEASGSLSWSDFLDLGRRTGTLGFSYPALRCCEKISPGTVPPDVLARCRQATPDRARIIVDRLEPALAHRVERLSLRERYMWSDSWMLRARQFTSELIPPGVTSIADFCEIYGTRARRLMRRTVTW